MRGSASRRRRPAAPLLARALLVLALLVPLALAGCRSGAPVPTAQHRDAVVVASFDFPESVLLAEIYLQALRAAGVPVRRELRLGPRELVQPALRQGLVDLVPEYLGTARSAGSLGGPGLRALRPAPAQDQNGLVVTRATARRLGLSTVSDLRGVASGLTFTGTRECRTRALCLPGLRRVYGITFGRVLPLDTEPQRVAALHEGVADVALAFTTDGRLATGDLVLLRDDRRLQPAENVVPVVTERAVARFGQRVVTTLDQVSALLTTENLRFLNWRVDVGGNDARAEARGWLRRHGLVTRSG